MSEYQRTLKKRQKYLNRALIAYKIFLAVGVVVSIVWVIWGQG
jgi:hypothetical protein